MKKAYDVLELLKPVRFTEQDSDATEAEDVDAKDNNDSNDKSDEKADNKSDDKSDNENKADGSEDSNGSEGSDENTENQENTEDTDKAANKEGDTANVDASKKALNDAKAALTKCGSDLDNVYKNNNLAKYGPDMTKTYQNGSKALWVGIGLALAAGVVFLCIKGIIPVKKILPKIPLVGKLFQGDKAAIKDVTSTVMGDNSMSNVDTNANNNGSTGVGGNGASQTAPQGSNPEQLADPNAQPTIENSVQAQANAKPGDIIQRNDGSKYVLNQGDIEWAKQQMANGKGNETVDQAEDQSNNSASADTNAQNTATTEPTNSNDANNATTGADNNTNAQAEQSTETANNPVGNASNGTEQVQADTENQTNGGAQQNQEQSSGEQDSISQVAADAEKAANITGDQPQGNTDAQSNGNGQAQNPNPTSQQQNINDQNSQDNAVNVQNNAQQNNTSSQFQNVKNNRKIMSEMNNPPTPKELESNERMRKSGNVKFSPLGNGWELATSGDMAFVINQFGHTVYTGRPGDAVIKEIPEWLKTLNFGK